MEKTHKKAYVSIVGAFFYKCRYLSIEFGNSPFAVPVQLCEEIFKNGIPFYKIDHSHEVPAIIEAIGIIIGDNRAMYNN